MPYDYKFTNETEQCGLRSFKLELTDSDNILPYLSIPIIFEQGQDTEEAMHELAARIISLQPPAPEPIVEEPPIVEELPIVEEQI